MLPTLVCRAPRALSFELRIDVARYPRVLFEKVTPMCGMWHALPAASDACARRVVTPRWGPVVLSHVSCQGAAWVSLETLWRCMCFVYVYNSRLVHSVHVWDVSIQQ